jgi:hypothetical protein
VPEARVRSLTPADATALPAGRSADNRALELGAPFPWVDGTVETTPVATAPLATSATTPSFIARPAPDAVVAPMAASDTAPAAGERALANHLSTGTGVIAVTAVRTVVLARCTSWRTAPSDKPMDAATSVRLRP